MSHVHRINFRAQHIGSALFSLVLLVSLLLPTQGMAKVEARHATPPPPSPTGLSDPRELEAFLNGVLSAQLRDDHIPGATVSVVKDGRLFFAKGYGSADLQAGTPVSAQTTLFQVGSVSKLFTATAVLQLAEQGKLNLHADVNTYLKTFHLPATYPEPITLAHLLTHTAGFEDQSTGTFPPTPSDLEPLGQWLAVHIPARVRPPGELTAYSNYGYALAGAMSATATDMANFMIAQLQNGRFGNQRILEAATAQAMQTQQFTNDPRVAGVTYGFEEQYLDSQRLLVHAGYIPPAFSSLLALLPEHQVGLFVSYNSAGGESAPITLLQAFLDHYFPAPKETRSSPPAGFAERISQISGDYWKTDRSSTTYEKLFVLGTGLSVSDGGNGRLLVSSLLGGPPWTFVEVAPWVFHRVDGPQTLFFRADPNGMLMMWGNGPDEPFIKVAWYDAPTLHLVLGVSCVLLFLSALLLWPLGFVRRAMRRRAPSSQSSRKADREGAQIIARTGRVRGPAESAAALVALSTPAPSTSPAFPPAASRTSGPGHLAGSTSSRAGTGTPSAHGAALGATASPLTAAEAADGRVVRPSIIVWW